MYRSLLIASIAVTTICSSCEEKSERKTTDHQESNTSLIIKDRHTLSNYNDVRVKHLDLKLAVDFTEKSISGTATWTFDRISDADTLILDTDELNIDSVILDNGKKAEFIVASAVPMQGAALKIPIFPESRS